MSNVTNVTVKKTGTPTMSAIEDNIENNTEDTQTKVVLSNFSDTLVKHQPL